MYILSNCRHIRDFFCVLGLSLAFICDAVRGSLIVCRRVHYVRLVSTSAADKLILSSYLPRIFVVVTEAWFRQLRHDCLFRVVRRLGRILLRRFSLYFFFILSVLRILGDPEPGELEDPNNLLLVLQFLNLIEQVPEALAQPPKPPDILWRHF